MCFSSSPSLLVLCITQGITDDTDITSSLPSFSLSLPPPSLSPCVMHHTRFSCLDSDNKWRYYLTWCFSFLLVYLSWNETLSSLTCLFSPSRFSRETNGRKRGEETKTKAKCEPSFFNRKRHNLSRHLYFWCTRDMVISMSGSNASLPVIHPLPSSLLLSCWEDSVLSLTWQFLNHFRVHENRSHLTLTGRMSYRKRKQGERERETRKDWGSTWSYASDQERKIHFRWKIHFRGRKIHKHWQRSTDLDKFVCGS